MAAAVVIWESCNVSQALNCPVEYHHRESVAVYFLPLSSLWPTSSVQEWVKEENLGIK